MAPMGAACMHSFVLLPPAMTHEARRTVNANTNERAPTAALHRTEASRSRATLLDDPTGQAGLADSRGSAARSLPAPVASAFSTTCRSRFRKATQVKASTITVTTGYIRRRIRITCYRHDKGDILTFETSLREVTYRNSAGGFEPASCALPTRRCGTRHCY